MTFQTMLREATPNLTAIAAHLDALTAPERLKETRELNRADQEKLFDLTKGFKPVTLLDLVPTSVSNMTGVPHEGKNTLPLFSLFAKVFYRPDDAATAAKESFWGYNRNSGLVETVVGPGYYVAYEQNAGEVLVDYLRLPPKPIPNGPAILPNDARLSRFVYNGTQDVLRGVSKHVTIGRASRNGAPMPNWFILCRDLA